MTISHKLDGIPTVYYFNLDIDTNRRSYMEEQFNLYGIKDYVRISGSKFDAKNIDSWQHILVGNYKEDHGYVVANFISHIDFFRWWLENTEEDCLIIMEDDYDLSLIDHWHFTWKQFVDHLPANWDCIQLGYEHPEYIIFCLHIKPPLDQLFGPCMLNRHFVKKLVNLYYKDGLFLINKRLGTSKEFTKPCPYSVDTAIINDGVTYRVPLITTNFDLCRPDRKKILNWHANVANTYHYWWTYKKNYFDLEDFFSYAHSNIAKMVQPVKNYSELFT